VVDFPGVTLHTVKTVVRTRHYNSLCADSWALKLSPRARTQIEHIHVEAKTQYRKLGIFLNLGFQAILPVWTPIRMDNGPLSNELPTIVR